MQNTHADLVQVVHDYMSDAETHWRLGDRAVFRRDDDEDVEISLDHAGGSILSAAGAVRITANATTRLIPAEGLTARSWAQAGLLCLREDEAAMAARTVLTELGSDMLATRPIDRIGILFDLGYGCGGIDCCVRTADDDLLRLLREHEGESIRENEDLLRTIDRAGADHVAISRLGRIENFGHRRQAIAPLAVSPPSGYLPCLAFVPPQQSCGAGFDEATHGAFRVLYGIFGDPELVRLKEAVIDAVRRGDAPGKVATEGSDAQLAVRVTLRQLAHRDGHSDTLERWRTAFGV